MLRTIDRYVIREVLPPSLIALLALTFALEVQPLAAIAEPLIQRGTEWSVTVRMMALTLPQALTLTIPMSLLCGILVALGRLSADSEYRAMQACGIGITRLLRPILALGFAFALMSAYVGFILAPAAISTFRAMAFRALADAGGEIQPQVFVNPFPSQTVFFLNGSQGVWQNVFIAESAGGAPPVVYLAREGHLQIDRDNRTLSIVLTDGTRHGAPADPGVYDVTRFRQTVVHLDWESVFPSVLLDRTISEMSAAELSAGIADPSRRARIAEMSVELHRRFFVPVACVVLAALGLAIGGTVATTGKFGGFFAAIIVIFLYYMMMFAGRAIVLSGRAPAWLAMWSPNAVLTIAAVGLLVWRARSGAPLLPSIRRLRRAPGRVALGERLITRSGSRARGLVWRTLDRYVARLYAAVWLLVFAGLVGLAYASLATDILTDLLRTSPSTWLIVPYFAYAFPQVAYYAVPMATLLSVLVTIGLLAKHGELVAMRACGISVYRTAAPLIVIGGAIGAGLFAIQEQVLPESARRTDAVHDQIRGRPASTFRKMSRNWVVGRSGTIYHFDNVDAARGTLHGLLVFDFFPGEWRLRRRISAKQAVDHVTGDMSPYDWTATSGEIWTFSGLGTPALGRSFSETAIRLEPISYFNADRPEANKMSYFELQRHIGDLQAGGTDVAPYIVALDRKLSFPFVTIVMTLIALPFAATTGKRGAVHGIGIGAGIAFAYWTVMSVCGALGGAGAVTPMLAAWAPNILFGFGAVYLLLRTRT